MLSFQRYFPVQRMRLWANPVQMFLKCNAPRDFVCARPKFTREKIQFATHDSSKSPRYSTPMHRPDHSQVDRSTRVFFGILENPEPNSVGSSHHQVKFISGSKPSRACRLEGNLKFATWESP